MKKIKVILCLFLMTIFLVGCTSQETDVKVKEDGSSSIQFKVTVNKDLYKDIEGYILNMNIKDNPEKINPLFYEKALEFKESGYEISQVNDDVEIGFIAKKNFLSMEEFNNEFSILNKKEILNSKLKLQSRRNLFKKEYRISGDLKYMEDQDFEDIMKKAEDQKISQKIDLSNAKARLLIGLPGITSGKREYTASYKKGSIKVDTQSKIYNKKVLFIIAVLSIILITFIMVKITYIVLSNRKKSKENRGLQAED